MGSVGTAVVSPSESHESGKYSARKMELTTAATPWYNSRLRRHRNAVVGKDGCYGTQTADGFDSDDDVLVVDRCIEDGSRFDLDPCNLGY